MARFDVPGRSLAGGRAAYLLTLSRPRFWLYLAGPVLVGVAHGAQSVPALFSLPTLALFGYFLLPANVLLYGVNDVFDADVDADNPKKRGREARWRGDPVVAGAVVSSALLGVGLFVLVPPLAWPYLVGFFLLGVEYSAPPLRFKTTPLLDSLSNGLYVLPGAAAYAALSGSHPPAAGLVGAWLWAMAMHTFSAVPDIDPDREGGIRTTATVLGERATLAYCAVAWLLAAGAFWVLAAPLGALLLVYPLTVVGIRWRGVAVGRAYWWYPALNTLVGMAMTLGGLWRLVA